MHPSLLGHWVAVSKEIKIHSQATHLHPQALESCNLTGYLQISCTAAPLIIYNCLIPKQKFSSGHNSPRRCIRYTCQTL